MIWKKHFEYHQISFITVWCETDSALWRSLATFYSLLRLRNVTCVWSRSRCKVVTSERPCVLFSQASCHWATNTRNIQAGIILEYHWSWRGSQGIPWILWGGSHRMWIITLPVQEMFTFCVVTRVWKRRKKTFLDVWWSCDDQVRALGLNFPIFYPN